MLADTPGNPKRAIEPIADLAVSRIGFGCASLMRSATARQRRNLLAAALGAGITHFDVARLYGLGAVEAEVGSFLRGRREATTIATKFGIETSGPLQRVRRFQSPARALLNRAPNLRSAASRRQSGFQRPRCYDAEIARRSLDKSLKELRLDYVDILFIHDPRPYDDVRLDELVPFLQKARAAGKIRAWGVSEDAFPDSQLARRLGPSAVLQQRHDALDEQLPSPAAIAFGVLAHAHERVTQWLRQDAKRHLAWRTALDADPLADGVLASLLVSQVLTESATRAVLYSSTNAQRLSTAAQLLRSPLPAEQIARFRQLLARESKQIGALAP